ncbi:hypothetical protein IW262DRAFT_1299673 [Armillaria fumosa]|nr:hypothetical protein IW262DRAFT_1299673 [Armillaria fumosa]
MRCAKGIYQRWVQSSADFTDWGLHVQGKTLCSSWAVEDEGKNIYFTCNTGYLYVKDGEDRAERPGSLHIFRDKEAKMAVTINWGKKITEPPYKIEDIPEVDGVFILQSHYDHPDEVILGNLEFLWGRSKRWADVKCLIASRRGHLLLACGDTEGLEHLGIGTKTYRERYAVALSASERVTTPSLLNPCCRPKKIKPWNKSKIIPFLSTNSQGATIPSDKFGNVVLILSHWPD